MNVNADSADLGLTDDMSGYAEHDDFVVQEFRQGSRTHYSLVVSLQQAVQLFPIPDPDQPFDDNRQVNKARADGFAKYVREFESWHAGALTIRCTTGLTTFDPTVDLGRIRVGRLRVPKGRSKEFNIVDGQHRQLGLLSLFSNLSSDRAHWIAQKQAAERAQDRSGIATATRELHSIEDVRNRVAKESVLVNLIVENDSILARQLFVDVADNALGVPKAVRARFDQKKVANRALFDLLLKPPLLLQNRVDDQKDRVTGSNKNLIGAGNLSDIVRILEVGIAGRFNKKAEETLSATHLANQAKDFFVMLVEVFPELGAVQDGSLSPEKLRKQSLLGSSTMLRILAGVTFEVRSRDGSSALRPLMRKLAEHMAAPIDPSTKSGRLWIHCGSTEAFGANAMAPGARSQQVKDAVASISEWVRNPPEHL